MDAAPPAPAAPTDAQLVVAWHQGLNAGAWRELALDVGGLQLPRPVPLLDPERPVSLKLRVGRASPVVLMARVEPQGGAGPRLVFGAVGPSQASALQAMAEVSSLGVSPLRALEEELSRAMDQLESEAIRRTSPSRLHLVYGAVSVLLLLSAALGLWALG